MGTWGLSGRSLGMAFDQAFRNSGQVGAIALRESRAGHVIVRPIGNVIAGAHQPVVNNNRGGYRHATAGAAVNLPLGREQLIEGDVGAL